MRVVVSGVEAERVWDYYGRVAAVWVLIGSLGLDGAVNYVELLMCRFVIIGLLSLRVIKNSHEIVSYVLFKAGIISIDF